MENQPSIAAYINADSQNAANMQYRIIIRYINEVLPGSTCFFFCDHEAGHVEFNRLIYLAGKKKFTHIVTCNRNNLPNNIMSILQLTELTLAIVHENSWITVIQARKKA